MIISGYVAILFGRSRSTEDIDLFVGKMDYGEFSAFYNKIISSSKYYCINAESSQDAYELLMEKSSIRFAEHGTVTPNFGVKFPQNELNLYSLENALTVDLGNRRRIKIGPLELQLAYKLSLGSDKDLDDADHLYRVFKNAIDKAELKRFVKKLHIKDTTAEKVFGKDYEKK